jgi:hypothetical protein
MHHRVDASAQGSERIEIVDVGSDKTMVKRFIGRVRIAQHKIVAIPKVMRE